jgi:hypothetical protein
VPVLQGIESVEHGSRDLTEILRGQAKEREKTGKEVDRVAAAKMGFRPSATILGLQSRDIHPLLTNDVRLQFRPSSSPEGRIDTQKIAKYFC